MDANQNYDTSELERLLARATADDGDRPPYWDPQPDEILAGALEYYTEGSTSFGERRIAVIRRHPDDEYISVWLSRSVLISEFERVNPQPGDGVVLKYFGEKQPKNPNGSAFHMYRLWKSSRQTVANQSAPTPTAAVPSPAAAASPSTPAPPSTPARTEPSDDDMPY